MNAAEAESEVGSHAALKIVELALRRQKKKNQNTRESEYYYHCDYHLDDNGKNVDRNEDEMQNENEEDVEDKVDHHQPLAELSMLLLSYLLLASNQIALILV